MAYIGLKPTAGENNSFRILDTLSTFTATFDGSSSSIVSLAADTISIPDHRFVTGQRVTYNNCLLYTSPSPRDLSTSRMPSSA